MKVCDFGLAGSMAESRSRHSRPGHTSGTTPYMSPQHLLLGSRTVSDDVYALGATLYELLTSKAPFYAGSIETQIERTPPPAIEERRAILITGAEPVPKVWEAVIQSCLDKKSENRPASAGAVQHQLTRQPNAEELKKAREAEARERPLRRKNAARKSVQRLMKRSVLPQKPPPGREPRKSSSKRRPNGSTGKDKSWERKLRLINGPRS